MARVKVTNLSDGRTRTYVGLSPEAAVVSAYAQGTHKDFNTWDYEERYAGMVTRGKAYVTCGDWTAPLHSPKE
jgi:hypothetical protein